MKTKLIDWLYGMLTFLPLIITIVVYPIYPKIIPTHFNSMGEVDYYGSKNNLFIVPLIVITFVVFWKFAFHFNKDLDIVKSKFFITCKMVVVSIFNVINCTILILIYSTIYSKTILDFFKVGAILICLGNIVIANYLPKCRQNGWFGIRTKWTLANEEVWHKTHRFGGWLLIISSIILIIMILFLKGFNCVYVVTIGELFSILIIVFYSYIIFSKVGGQIE